jgi:glutathione synthase/RimK-type ligase-like ATP-grasp enzyme
MRPLAKHGGDDLILHNSVDTLWPALEAHNAPCYLTMFRNFRSEDGYFRKYRIVFVDREPFAYHLAISSQWMVHYVSADMTTVPWKLDEEHRFLANASEVLAERATQAIAAIGRRLDLDYAGIDFTVLPDGRVLVFEANATMLIHRESSDGVLAHKNAFVQRIVDAFEQLQSRVTGTSR